MERLPIGGITIPPEHRATVSQRLSSGRCYDIGQLQADAYNRVPGKLTGYDCPKCLNRGDIARSVDGHLVVGSCECLKIRDSIRRMAQSGLAGSLETCTFDGYIAQEPWQHHAKERAMAFAEDTDGQWFYIGGQVGAGKTHLCTAIVGRKLEMGQSARYMMWRDDTVELKGHINDDYSAMVAPLKACDVLYIDDLFKGFRQGSGPTPADLSIAFELLNHRYQSRKTTIISSEYTLDDILELDEAIASRIYERARDYILAIGRDSGRNYRMR
jgi:DNA replication protein DnaC